jgi:PKD repeat protein
MKRLIIGLLMVLLLFVGTVACSRSNESVPVPAPTPAPVPTPSIASPAPAPAPESASIFGSKSASAPPVVIQETPPPVINIPAPSPAPAPAPSEDYYGGVDQSWAGDRMIIRTASMYLVVEDVAKTVEQITQLASTYNGFVVSSNSWQEQDRMMGNIAIRVEVGNFDNAMMALRALAVEVRSESTSGQDVTEEYVDLSAQLRNLEASEAQLLELMKQAGKVDEILEVQRELVKTRGEIEQTKGRMQYLEKSSSMSLIQINLEQSKLTVEFNADPRSVKAGREVWFFPTVSGGFTPYSYEWDFGDGGTSTDAQPSHVYKSDGKYTVSLKVTDDRGNTIPKQRDDYITVIAGWKASNTATSAWNGLVGFGHVLTNFFIWLGYFSPLWIVIGVIVYFAWWRRRKKKA